MALRVEGIVTRFDRYSGFGFIEAAGRPAVFVHVTAIADSSIRALEPGQRVTFELIDDMGPRAANVCLAGRAPAQRQDETASTAQPFTRPNGRVGTS